MTVDQDVLAAALADVNDEMAVPAIDKLQLVERLIKQQVHLEDLKESLEEQLKKVNKELELVMDKQLPDALMEAGCSRFDTAEGLVVKTQNCYYPSVKKADEPEVFDELAKMGHAGIISTSVVIDLGKGGHDEGKELLDRLQPLLNKHTPVLSESIHWATFRAFAKEQIEADEILPENIKVHSFTRATIKRPK